ncbi:hypothetical protein RDABS01_006846, partial [Bienertia sinuspersici]
MEIQSRYNVGSIFALYASINTLLSLANQSHHQFTPKQIRDYIDSKLKDWFSKQKILDPRTFTLVITEYHEDWNGCNSNNLYSAIEAYLSIKLRSISTRLKAYHVRKQPVAYQLAQGEEFSENVNLDENNKNVNLQWKFCCCNPEKGKDSGPKRSSKSFELSFDPRYKDGLSPYLPFVVVKNYEKFLEMKKELYLFTYGSMSSRGWNSVKFKHPFTFDALALDPKLKQLIVDELDRFVRRREFYKKIGRAWKRGYLLYGPPGTGKSSLMAAIANYLKFNVYDLQLGSIMKDYMSILLSLSGLLNFIDGLWSSCGEERIIILTTNHKERLDPALLRPGRMDLHIHMSYLRMT